MSQKYEKLKALLKELFQLDQPELDFGIYRILHARSAEVTQFLDKDLLPQVKQAFSQYRTADKAELEKELAKAVEAAQALGVDPESTQKVKELRARLASEAVDTEALEAEVYDHLYSFFRRYYSEGDFLSKRVYKPGVYAIPYEGEEVKLHWANADQYYIKTSEYLRDYAFRLRPEDERNPKRVHFRLVDAAEGEHGNVKEQAGKERRFKLAPAPFAAVENGELVIRFTYEPDPAKQKDLNAEAESAILALDDPALADWIKALGGQHVRADGTVSENTRLRVHLDRYTARNTFDYFIHKDLGGFLRRELDFYIKNEVMHLDDVENETAPRVEQYLSKIKVIRRIAHKIIDFLAQIEDFQKKLWLKKKFVVETQYCITLDRIFAIEDEGTRDWLVEQIIQNDAQREEWVRLFAIDTFKGDLTTPGYTEPLKPEFLKAHPTLVVDTRHFDEAFKLRLLAAIPDIDEETDGLLIHSENFQALNLLKERYRTQVKCVYIDPPFNTGGDFPYKDSFRNSSWIELFWDRLNVSLPIFSPEGNYFIHLDHNAIHYGKLLFEMTFPEINELIFNTNATKDEESGLFSYKSFGQKFVRQHDTILHGYNSTNNFVKLWKPNRNTSRLDLGQLDLISRGKVSTPRSLEDFEFYIEKYQDGTLVEHIVDRGEEKIFPIGDIWNDLYSFTQSEMRVSENLSFRTQKPENLVRRIIQTCTVPGDLVLDFFAGSGTTPAVSHKLRRKYIGVEMGDYFETTYQEYDATSKTWIEKLGILGRMKNVLHGDVAFKACGKDRRSTLSKEIGWAGGGMFKYIRLESYEDTLNNLELRRTEAQQSLLDSPQAQGPDGFKEQYLLRYMLDVETRGSQSLLNVSAFMDPTAYRLKVKRPGSDESREVNVDLLETFNWLIGLKVDHIAAPRTYSAAFRRADDPDLPADAPRRLLLDGGLKEDPDGLWWFRTVTGSTPDGRRTLVIWRKRPGGEDPEGIERDNLVLDEWFKTQKYSTKDSEFDLIYVNGDNNLENLKTPGDTWQVRPIEEDFFRLMFDTEGV